MGKGRDQKLSKFGSRPDQQIPSTTNRKSCKFCGKKHEFKRNLCPAADKEYRKCKEKGHFANVCQSAKKPLHTLEDEESFSEEDNYDITDEKPHAISTAEQSNSDQVLVTCTVNTQHQVTFEIDTGTSCSILPFHDYVGSTGDKKGHRLKKTTTCLIVHNNSCEYPLGQVM